VRTSAKDPVAITGHQQKIIFAKENVISRNYEGRKRIVVIIFIPIFDLTGGTPNPASTYAKQKKYCGHRPSTELWENQHRENSR